MNTNNLYSNSQYTQVPPPLPTMEDQLSLSSYVATVMRKVYMKMTLGLIVTALVALFVASSEPILYAIFSNQFIFWGLMIAELAMVWILAGRINKLSTATATALFFAYSALNGVTLSAIFVVYTASSIASTFFITAGVFGAMTIYGYTTKQDLSKIGSFLFMGLIGLIIASVVNVFLGSDTMQWIISLAGVAIFIGLTAWDTQAIKRMAMESDYTNAGKVATLGALELYLDFVNLFLYLLRIFGSRD